MNDLLAGVGTWKPVLAALLLPPVSLLLLLLAGFLLRLAQRPVSGLALIVTALFGLWFSHCTATGEWLEQRFLQPALPLTAESLPGLRRELAGNRAAVLVLGAGRDLYAPEYGEAMLDDASLRRLHYGLWLARRIEQPVMVSGGIRLADRGERPTAEIAERMARQDYGRPLRWIEAQSRDMRGMARNTLPVLARQQIGTIVLVTDRAQMRRARRALEDAAEIAGLTITVLPAPLGNAQSSRQHLLDWLPSAEGYVRVHTALYELGAWWTGS
jgi:uncharacterized SAM-binding protein YcdF (DUF218 family)